MADTRRRCDRYQNTDQGITTYNTYNDRSELTSEVMKVGTGSTILTGRDNPTYDYDKLGNRKSVTHNGDSASYTVNVLNQYTQRSVPGYFDVAGAAGSGATVTVNGSGTGVTRHYEYFFKKHPLTNTSNPVFTTLTISDGTTTSYLDAYLQKTPEAFTYDVDGNMLTDGRNSFQYDAENRIKWQEPIAAAVTAGLPKIGYNYYYDYLGRRVRKLSNTWNGSAWVPQTDRRFIYTGWNPVAEFWGAYNADNFVSTFSRQAFWGLDLSGTTQGAGGIGGLLMVTEAGSSYLPAYDALGNIHAILNTSGGTLAACYEYDAYGQTLRASGTYAETNPFRFSTKFTDAETGLVYYGLRYYSPALGRFINRDPIEEHGGLNLYGFCGNDGVNHWDYLGQFSLRKLFKKFRKFLGKIDPIGRHTWLKWDQKLDDWAFKTLQRNPWIVSAVTTILSFTPFAWVSPIINAAWTMENGGSFGQVAFAAVGSYIGQSVSATALGELGGFTGVLARNTLSGAINGGIGSRLSGGSFWKGFRAGAISAAVFTVAAEVYTRTGKSGDSGSSLSEASEEEVNAHLLHNVDSNNHLTGHTAALVRNPDDGKWYKLDLGKGENESWFPFDSIDFDAKGRVTNEGLRNYERAISFKFTEGQARAAFAMARSISEGWTGGRIRYFLGGSWFGRVNCTTATISVLNAGGAGLRSQGIWNAPQAIFDLNRHKGVGVGRFGTH